MESVYLVVVDDAHAAFNAVVYVRIDSLNAVFFRRLQGVNGIDITWWDKGGRTFPQPFLKNVWDFSRCSKWMSLEIQSQNSRWYLRFEEKSLGRCLPTTQ